jgi:hypothetical protein
MQCQIDPGAMDAAGRRFRAVIVPDQHSAVAEFFPVHSAVYAFRVLFDVVSRRRGRDKAERSEHQNGDRGPSHGSS